MANEISVLINFTVTNGNFSDVFQPATQTINQAAQGFHGPMVTVGTTQEYIPTGDIGTMGWFCGRNLDAANFVTVGVSTGSTGSAMTAYGRIEAGESFAYRVEPGANLAWKADTSAVKVQMKLHED